MKIQERTSGTISMISFLTVLCYVYVIDSLIRPTDTLNITLQFTRQLQDEVALYKTKIAAATRAADEEHLRGNTVTGSFRFIKNDIQATIQTAINAAALLVRIFILLSILLLTTLVDIFKFYRHVIDSTFDSLARKRKGKKINYRSKNPSKVDDTSIVTLVVSAPLYGANKHSSENLINNDTLTSPTFTRREPEDLPWFKTLFPSGTACSSSNDRSSGTVIGTDSSISSERDGKNEWNGTAMESDMPIRMSDIRTTTLLIGDHGNSNAYDSKPSTGPGPDTCSVKEDAPFPLLPSSSKSSLATVATKKKLLSMRRKKQPSIVKRDMLSPPRPLAVYSSRPFNTSNVLVTASALSHPIGSSLSLKLKQPGRKLSLLFKTKK